MDDDGTGQDPVADTEGRASAFRRVLDAQAEAAEPGHALIPSGPHDLTAPIDRAQIREALADGDSQQAEVTAEAEAPAAADARTRVPPWSPEINWVEGAPGSTSADSTRTVVALPMASKPPAPKKPTPPPADGSRTKSGRLWIALLASTAVVAAAVIVFIQADSGSTSIFSPSALPTEPAMSEGAIPAASLSGKIDASATTKASGTATASSSKPSSSASAHGSATVSATPTSTAKASGTASPSSTAAGAAPGASSTGKGAASTALSNAQTGQCLNTPGSAYSSGAVEQVAACSAGAFQSWTLTSSGQLTQDGGSYCLDDYDWDSSAGSEVDLWTCNGGSNQQWTIESNGSIVGISSNLCVTATGQGGAVELEPCNGSAGQKWSWG